jgi:hypothetical protein
VVLTSEAKPLGSGVAEANELVLPVTVIMPGAAAVACSALKLSKALVGLIIIRDRAGSVNAPPRVTNNV